MNSSKESMRLIIIAKVFEEELFKNSDEATLTKEYYRKEFATKVAKRSAGLIIDALKLVKQGIPEPIATEMVFLKDKVGESIAKIIAEKDCTNCPASGICTDKHCEKAPEDMSNDEINHLLDNLGKKNEK